MIPVTRTFLPSIEEYTKILNTAWERKWITNRGELVLELEAVLRKYLDVKNILITNNGTIPLQIAVKLLGEGGEVITTPFSYVATVSSIVWQNCKPVFVDIDPLHLTIDEQKIEAAITSSTTAILATHVFGNPCNVEVIQSIADKHGLKVIYDAAHGFGVKYRSRSLFNYGDISTCSFHATKLFHTGEGGALFCNDEELFQKLSYSHNFGHKNNLEFYGLGINGKISELQAAMGLALFPYLETILSERKRVVEVYDSALDFSKVQKIRIREHCEWNYSYYPVIFESEADLLRVESSLNQAEIYPRRYFYPSLNTVNFCRSGSMPVSESVSQRVLCLPLYAGLLPGEVMSVCNIINNAL